MNKALKTFKISTKIDPKWRVRGIILGGRGLHFGVILGVWAGSGYQMRLGRRFGWLLGDFQSQDGSNLRPKRAPNWSQNCIKIDAKICRKIDGFGNRFLEGFWWILGGKMEASWHQNGIKIRSYLEMCEKGQTNVKPMKFQ